MGHGNLLDVLEAALGLTLIVVGFGLSRQSFTGKRVGSGWVVRAGEPPRPAEPPGPDEAALAPPPVPQWYHRLYTLFMGTALAALGTLVLWLLFFAY